jgi:trehalose 6-phosphate synthase/phosphatase
LIDIQLKPQDGVIIVSYFLPVILSKDNQGLWSVTWDKENILSLQLGVRLSWVGSVRYANAPIPLEDEEAVARVLADINCYPVFINQNTHYQFYDIFCKQNLWPVMHHIADVYGPLNQNDIGAKTQQNLWFVYSTVHKLFREKVLEVYHETYLIWIHGFHLMLLPSYLRRRLPLAKIGYLKINFNKYVLNNRRLFSYFFHTPFPSSEIWRAMTRREDLLRGILGADQIGFHLYEYARHFLTTCRRVLVLIFK